MCLCRMNVLRAIFGWPDSAAGMPAVCIHTHVKWFHMAIGKQWTNYTAAAAAADEPYFGNASRRKKQSFAISIFQNQKKNS